MRLSPEAEFIRMYTNHSAAGIAAQNVVRDIERGYFEKLLLAPVSRVALLLSTILAGALILGLPATIVVGVGLLLGLKPATGWTGLLTVIHFSVLLGTGLAGFTVSAALGSGNAPATHGASFVFFPLIGLAPTFVPVDLLEGWLATAAKLNPITHVLGATRALIVNSWDTSALGQGLLACLLLATVTYLLAFLTLRSRTRRA